MPLQVLTAVVVLRVAMRSLCDRSPPPSTGAALPVLRTRPVVPPPQQNLFPTVSSRAAIAPHYAPMP